MVRFNALFIAHNIGAVKEEALSALTSPVNEVEDIPEVKSKSDFELCRTLKDKGRPTGEYEVLDVSKQLKEYGFASYDAVYIQFRDPSGELLPIVFQSPSIHDEEDEEPSETDFGALSDRKGKRKAQD
ncbi:hypothetical protein H0H92_015256 [Tricholoma furcatifolium]|nr:hypothetical protein H0H92_015256 [Tricholoma furcatifolium]